MTKPPFRLLRPSAVTAPVVVASPHSGRNYGWEFLSRTVLDSERIRSSEDAYVDLLLDRVPALGVPVLLAEVPRAVLDLNRAAEELDPAVIRDVPRGATNPRVSSGLGVIPRVVAQGRAIYRGKISHAEALERIEQVWHPYHTQLDALLAEAQAQFGHALLIDCHSMPHEAIEGSGGARGTPEIVLGDRFGASSDPGLVEMVEEVFTDLGFRVARNAPFAGAYTMQAYGKPAQGRHALQIEIDRALYLDEARVRPNDRFDGMQNLMTEALSRICAAMRPSREVAAE
ncbi:N-formylglutamate amidohydrolase [Jannaschia seohaensis]|uniref:N-formylglutamate amidohydrolase n=1 Tax=Jannaschia seohaensis TaxID=475081 RepID=A0A2Y9B563_9RHOB|nr:N-formylglutamate amidohydrolase [Jannaschia seohaensis]PWJ10919.1 N-formylglutamate amidohydrolase [Jannaschia seohaensis]SSA51520.1 N-formylglutamate amidohydrolase [Jannaschia seohaensis]